MSGEFDLIARYLKPLSSDCDGAFQLTDDAAAVAVPAGRRLIVTKDALVAGRHFRTDTAPGDVATKALRVNLSDLAAMGAEPIGYLLALILPPGEAESWLAGFTSALAADQKLFGVGLLGGDTVATDGPLTVTVTALGHADDKRLLRRSGARVGDDVYVSGQIGDAALALDLMEGRLSANLTDRDLLLARYHRPDPRLGLGHGLAGLATAAIDISDGLAADLGHICACSGAGASIDVSKVPLSAPARALIGNDPDLWQRVLTGGDDYELAFTAAPGVAELVAQCSRDATVPVTKIGKITAGEHVEFLDRDNNEIFFFKKGYNHFLK